MCFFKLKECLFNFFVYSSKMHFIIHIQFDVYVLAQEVEAVAEPTVAMAIVGLALWFLDFLEGPGGFSEGFGGWQPWKNAMHVFFDACIRLVDALPEGVAPKQLRPLCVDIQTSFLKVVLAVSNKQPAVLFPATKRTWLRQEVEDLLDSFMDDLRGSTTPLVNCITTNEGCPEAFTYLKILDKIFNSDSDLGKNQILLRIHVWVMECLDQVHGRQYQQEAAAIQEVRGVGSHRNRQHRSRSRS